ncbi:MAG TPA: hypothetical protein VHM93_19770 [Candidatus Acidoferrum sp.]|jgi:hypothetical protein|nr:hypothetical protein [Candidatus Acidoferrum sp.]
MRRLIYFCLLATLSLPLVPLWAQDKTQEKPKSEERAAALIPIKVQVVFAEFEGDKKISSMPYSFTVPASDKPGGNYGASIRTGVRVPIETDGKDQKTTYIDVGSNIDCRIQTGEDGRFLVSLNFDRSAIYPNKSSEGERLVNEPNGLPLIRQFRTNESLLLRDGQTSENTLSTDPLNGHTMRVSVTINVQK